MGDSIPIRYNYRPPQRGSTGAADNFLSVNYVRATLIRSPPPRRRRRAFDWSTATIAVLAFAAAATVYARDGRAHFFSILLGDVTLFA